MLQTAHKHIAVLRRDIREGSVFREHAAAAVGLSPRTARGQDDAQSSWPLAACLCPRPPIRERLACTPVLDLNTFDHKVSLVPLWIEGNQHVAPIDQIGAAFKLSLSCDAV